MLLIKIATKSVLSGGGVLVLALTVWCAFPAAMAFAASMDLVTMTIPNRISLFLIAAFAILAPAVGLGLVDIGWHLASGAMILAIGIGMFAMGWVGGGDAKMFAAIALWFGFDHLGDFALIAVIAGGLLTVALLAFRMAPLPLMFYQQDWIVRLHHPRTGVPYGIALAAGALIVYPSTPYMQALLS
jgi:prepilin peptidase CpaA